MAISITFDDFDTVCYGSRDNIIKLINHIVGLSIDINITISSINNQLEEISAKADEGHDAFLLVENLNTRVSSVERRVKSIEEMDPAFYSTNLGEQLEAFGAQIKDLQERVEKLE